MAYLIAETAKKQNACGLVSVRSGRLRKRPKMTRTLFLLRLFLVLSLLMFSIGCETVRRSAPLRCPRPNVDQAADFRALVEGGRELNGQDRPAVVWVGRVVGYCWPAEVRRVRGSE